MTYLQLVSALASLSIIAVHVLFLVAVAHELNKPTSDKVDLVLAIAAFVIAPWMFAAPLFLTTRGLF